MKTFSAFLLTVVLFVVAETPTVSAQQQSPISNRLPTLNNFERGSVVRFYHQVYRKSQNVPIEWSGDWKTCTPGTVSQAYNDAILLRVNYFRRMSGLTEVTLDETLNRKAQKAALMMSAQMDLSHFPGKNWACYSEEGAAAAGQSNLALGVTGPEAIDVNIDDGGDNNFFVGHRRWVLYPGLSIIGTGSVPSGLTNTAAHVLLVLGAVFAPRPNSPEWTAWPPPGLVPVQVLPLGSGRWSFSYAGADFSNAIITMAFARDGVSIPLTTESQQNDQGYGDNTIVWIPDLKGMFVLKFDSDRRIFVNDLIEEEKTRRITISNVIVKGVARIFTYDVTVIDPERTSLTIRRENSKLVFTVPDLDLPFELEWTDSLQFPVRWNRGAKPLSFLGNITLDAPESTRFYRAVVP